MAVRKKKNVRRKRNAIPTLNSILKKLPGILRDGKSVLFKPAGVKNGKRVTRVKVSK